MMQIDEPVGRFFSVLSTEVPLQLDRSFPRGQRATGAEALETSVHCIQAHPSIYQLHYSAGGSRGNGDRALWLATSLQLVAMFSALGIPTGAVSWPAAAVSYGCSWMDGHETSALLARRAGDDTGPRKQETCACSSVNWYLVVDGRTDPDTGRRAADWMYAQYARRAHPKLHT